MECLRAKQHFQKTLIIYNWKTQKRHDISSFITVSIPSDATATKKLFRVNPGALLQEEAILTVLLDNIYLLVKS